MIVSLSSCLCALSGEVARRADQLRRCIGGDTGRRGRPAPVCIVQQLQVEIMFSMRARADLACTLRRAAVVAAA